MKKSLLRASLAAGLGLLSAASVAGESAGVEPAAFPAPSPLAVPWTAVAASGGVEARVPVESGGEWQGVRRGDELPPRTDLRTGDRGRATLTRHGSLLIVDPKTELELPSGATDGLETSVLQNSGSVLYRVDGRKHKHFEVVTPYLVAGVKGTEFLVTVNERYTAVTVAHGLVEITDVVTGDVHAVGEGQAMLRSRDAEGVELVDRGERGSARMRKESRRLEQMDRRDVEGSAPAREEKHTTGDDVAGSKEDVPGRDGEQPVAGTAADPLLGLDGDWQDQRETKGTEQVGQDLLEELIHEETKEGLLPTEDKKQKAKGQSPGTSESSDSSSNGSGNSGSGSRDSGNSGSGSGKK